ncbi:carbohydrate porin [Saccharibacter sp. 17.LH.SD]|uniref:carbohydrate porin n=1 Tax=Saccharibacter sp. 17.LH.SD TaxID=2689393 RepID=UPI0013690599|nr:carbohydrate porin [Saccharibacter sp. 17.LH.SD]MXV43786.1 carbohydrate porin [Saccharibacter sp. 17.LH.SD]
MNVNWHKMVGRVGLVSLVCFGHAVAQDTDLSDGQDRLHLTKAQRASVLQPYRPMDGSQSSGSFIPKNNLPIPGDPLAPYPGSKAAPHQKQTGFFPNSFQDWLQQDSVFGDPYGWRSYLQDHGVTFGGRYFSETAGNPVGGKSKSTRYADEIAFSIDFNLKKLTGLSIGILHFMTTARQGAGIGQTLPAVDSPQEIFGSGETMRLTRLSWEMPWNRYVSTEVGEINTENDFEASSTYWGANLYCQFQNNGICGMPQSIAMNSGYGYYPTAHPGAWVKFYPAGNDHYQIQFGAYSVEPNISAVRNGWRLGVHQATGTFLPFQLGWHQGGKDDYSGPLQTNVHIGGYWDTSEVKNVYSQLSSYGVPAQLAQEAQVSKVRGRFGGWVQVDRMLERDENDPRRSTAFFGSFTWGDPRTAVAPYFMTLGVVRKGTFAGRPDDTIALGMKTIWINEKLTKWARNKQNAGAMGVYKPSSETALELNYGCRLARWLLIRPGAQYIWSPGATNRYKNALLLDLQASVTF